MTIVADPLDEGQDEGAAQLEQLIASVLDVPLHMVTDELGFHDIPEWSSVNHVDLMLAVEAHTGQRIDGEMVLELSTVAAIKRFARGTPVLAAPVPGAAPAATAAGATGAPPDDAVRRGLDGVVFDESAVTCIDGTRGRLLYRGYSIHDLAEHARFEEAVHLLVHGRLPTDAELAALDVELRAARSLPDPVLGVVAACREGHPMDVLRTAASALAVFDPDRLDRSRAAVVRKGVRLVAQLPTVLASHAALRKGAPPPVPDPSLGHAANLLLMLTGEADPALVRILDRVLVLHADHSSNASAFAARVATGTEADLHAAVAAAIATFSGPLHGGAVERVIGVVDEIGSPDLAAAYVGSTRARREPVMGFGHRIYRTEDPRARHMRADAHALSARAGGGATVPILEAMREAMQPYARHGLNVNVDFYASAIYQALGIDADLFAPMFVVGRVAGWVAHVLEQLDNNVLIRPRMRYTGPEERPWVPLERRVAP